MNGSIPRSVRNGQLEHQLSMDFTDTGEINSLALQTRNVHKFYGAGRKASHVLKGLDVDVPYGTIYGLLGASGCGKTTLLKCVLGRLPIHSGRILVLGRAPGSKGHQVPGSFVGYMPQDTALVLDFTMLELMYYFGLLYRMNLRYTRKRAEFLKEFLNIPSIHKRCGLMSGGQRRRVSFALALLHEPPLLLLDEPTIGIDPLLRSRIWQHLLEITSSGNTTIIMTTHYIEEARQAHVVGLMRSGKLLAQSKPDDLIRAFNVNTLEDVFLKLSEEEELAGQRSANKVVASINYPSSDPHERTSLLHGELVEDDIKPPPYFSVPKMKMPSCPKFFHILALLWKQLLKFIRSPLILILIILSPLLQMAVFCLAYGREAEDIKFYVANFDSKTEIFPYFELGERFISYIDKDTVDVERTNDPSEGIKQVEDGKAFGFLLIPMNYTQNFIQRELHICEQVLWPNGTYNDSYLDNSTISVTMDISNQQIFYTVNQTLNDAFEMLLGDIESHEDDTNFHIDRRPLIYVSQYVYGDKEINFDDTVNSAMFGSIIFTLSVILTVTQLITERREGVADRTWVAGVKSIEIVLSQILSFFIVLVIQTVIMFIVITYAFDLPREGNLFLAYIIVLLQGMTGVILGLKISAYVESTSLALQVSFGVFFPIFLLSGLLWPLKSWPKGIQFISKFVPQGLPSEATRFIFIRGWGLDHETVWLSFVVLFGWMFLLLLLIGLRLFLRN